MRSKLKLTHLICFVQIYATAEAASSATPAHWGQVNPQVTSAHPCMFHIQCQCSLSDHPVHRGLSLRCVSLSRLCQHSPSNWPHLNMPRHHLLLNGPLWSKCQTGKVLKKKCPHLLSWHFPQRPFPLLTLYSLLARSRSFNKGPCSTLTAHKPTLCQSVCILTRLYPHVESEMNNPHWYCCHVYLSPALECHVDGYLIGSKGEKMDVQNRSQMANSFNLQTSTTTSSDLWEN